MRQRYYAVLGRIARNVKAGMNVVDARRDAVAHVFRALKYDDARDWKARAILRDRDALQHLLALGLNVETIDHLRR